MPSERRPERRTALGRLARRDRGVALRSEPYTVKPKGWVLWLLAPAGGSTLAADRPTVLAAQAYHVEERRPSLEGIRWTSSLDGILGTGGRVQTVLSAGEHRLTATRTAAASRSPCRSSET